MLRVIMLPFGLYCGLVAILYGIKIKVPRRQRKLIWSTCVLSLWALATLAYGLGAFIHSFTYLVTVQIVLAISFMLIATIPCGIAFFNQKKLRALRNLFCIAVGLMNLWVAIEWLHLGWAS